MKVSSAGNRRMSTSVALRERIGRYSFFEKAIGAVGVTGAVVTYVGARAIALVLRKQTGYTGSVFLVADYQDVVIAGANILLAKVLPEIAVAYGLFWSLRAGSESPHWRRVRTVAGWVRSRLPGLALIVFLPIVFGWYFWTGSLVSLIQTSGAASTSMIFYFLCFALNDNKKDSRWRKLPSGLRRISLGALSLFLLGASSVQARLGDLPGVYGTIIAVDGSPVKYGYILPPHSDLYAYIDTKPDFENRYMILLPKDSVARIDVDSSHRKVIAWFCFSKWKNDCQ